MRVVVDVGSRMKVRIVGKGAEDGGGSGTGDCPGVHLPEHHASGFKEADRGVYGQ